MKKITTHLSKVVTSIILFLSLSLSTFAQTDSSATPEPPKDPLIVRYLISSDLSLTAGNLFSFTTVNKAQLELEKKVVGAKFFVSYRYGFLDSAENVTSNELVATALISLFPKKRVYAFMNGGYERSFLRGINYRAYGGLGANFRVVDTDNHKFEPYINVLYEYNKYASPIVFGDDTTDVVQTARGVVGWTGLHKVAKGKLIITHDAKYSQSLQVANNFRVEGNVALTVPIIKILNVKTAFGATYENVVPVGRKKADFIWTFGIVLTNI